MPKKYPELVPLEYGTVYCELGHETIHAGQLVAWWRLPGEGGRKRPAAYCQNCHYENLRAGKPLR